MNVSEGAAYDAAMLAGVGIGVYRDVRAVCNAVTRITGSSTPSGATSLYADYYQRYRALYPTPKSGFEAMGHVVEKQKA